MKITEILLAALAASLVACASRSTASEEKATATAGEMALRVERGDLPRRLLLSGEMVAEEAAVAVAPVVRIWPLQVRWLAEDGSQVAAGERVVEFDNAQLASRLQDLKSRVVDQASKLDEAEARAAAEESAARLELERKRAALRKAEIRADVPEGILAAKELADRKKELAAARLELAAAQTAFDAKQRGGQAAVSDTRLALAQAERELATIEESLERLVVRAPRAGLLTVGEYWQEPRPIREGDQVWPGMTVARIPDLSTLVVRARLYDVDDGLVASGAKVQAFLDAFPGRAFAGTIRDVERIAQPVKAQSLRRAFQVVVDLARGDRQQLRPGMSVRVEVPLPLHDVVNVPRRALAWRGSTPTLQLADGSRPPVRLGPCSATRCALVEGPRVGTLLAEASGDGGS
ncbi:MAG TPA: efflux RND transporter periplasmic adaptor subunit [Thermoanaerobaculia bacterium]|jgi:multidrug resistance efflux pump|nr:efflux RND transporter periplasmic adaptor subunit [Thermoanaerobaculia bacterium]